MPDLAAPHGPFGMRKPRRSFRATGVITADLIERTFVPADSQPQEAPQVLVHR